MEVSSCSGVYSIEAPRSADRSPPQLMESNACAPVALSRLPAQYGLQEPEVFGTERLPTGAGTSPPGHIGDNPPPACPPTGYTHRNGEQVLITRLPWDMLPGTMWRSGTDTQRMNNTGTEEDTAAGVCNRTK